jgi:hypothetical protein
MDAHAHLAEARLRVGHGFIEHDFGRPEDAHDNGFHVGFLPGRAF